MFVVAYKDEADSAHGKAVVGTLSGNAISFGSEYIFNSGTSSIPFVEFDPNTANKFVIVYKDESNMPTNRYGTAIVGIVSGTSISFGTKVAFSPGNAAWFGVSFDPNTANKFVIVYRDYVNSGVGKTIVGTISGTSISYGSDSTFTTAAPSYPQVSFDPHTAGQFLLTYVASDQGKARIGTVSGTSVTYGTEYAFSTSGSDSYVDAAFDPNTANKFVIVFNHSGTQGRSLIGTVSGTSLSFGAEVTFNASSTTYTQIRFDPNNSGKFVISYRDDGNSSYGTTIIGTLSGTSLSYSSEYVYNSGNTPFGEFAFDPNSSGKFVVVHTSGGGNAIVGQIAAAIPTRCCIPPDNLLIDFVPYANAATASMCS